MTYNVGDILEFKDNLAQFVFKITNISERIPNKPIFHIEVLYMIIDPFILGPPDALGGHSIVTKCYVPNNIEQLKVLYGS